MEKIITREYDINVYVVDGVARLSAYEYLYSDNPNGREPISTDTAKFHTLEVPMTPQNHFEVAFLLDDLDWANINGIEWVDGSVPTVDDIIKAGQDKWQDYDSPWENMAWFDKPHVPKMIKDWADGLPEYEAGVAHEWEENRLDLAYGERRDVKCLNCDETYEQRRLSWEELRAIK